MDMYWEDPFAYAHGYAPYLDAPMAASFMALIDGAQAEAFAAAPPSPAESLDLLCPPVKVRPKKEDQATTFGKTRLCKFFMSGGCREGAACTFAHGQQEMRPSPDLFRSELCYGMQKRGRCTYGAKCKFAHSVAELYTKGPRPEEAEEGQALAAPPADEKMRVDAWQAAPSGRAARIDISAALNRGSKPVSSSGDGATRTTRWHRGRSSCRHL